MNKIIRKNYLSANEKIILRFFQNVTHYLTVFDVQKIDDRYWIYISRNSLCRRLKLTKDKVRYAIEKLIKKRLLISKDFLKRKQSKTLWYAIENENLFIF